MISLPERDDEEEEAGGGGGSRGHGRSESLEASGWQKRWGELLIRASPETLKFRVFR